MRIFILMILTSLMGCMGTIESRPSVAAVSVSKVIRDSAQGKEAAAKLAAEVKTKQKELDDKKAEAKKLKGDKLKKAYADLNALYQQHQKSIQTETKKTNDELWKKLSGILKHMVEKGHYDLLLNDNDSNLVFVSPQLNLTEQAIKQFNEAYPPEAKK